MKADTDGPVGATHLLIDLWADPLAVPFNISQLPASSECNRGPGDGKNPKEGSGTARAS
jgi:hypothetical protein